MARSWLAVFSAMLVLSSPRSAVAEINGHTAYKLDLTNARELPKKAEWSEPNYFKGTPEGLGWGSRDDQGSRDFWLRTEPIGIGLSWRPTSIASIKATVDCPGTPGILYARYSIDGKRWTTWQLVETATPAAKSGPKVVFETTLRVPYRENARYHELRLEYARRDDVPWGSDEEALVKDILKREPKFFEQHTPFIGYVQFLYEADLHGGQRMKSLQIDVRWFLGGKHVAPRDEKDRVGREVPWRFKAP